ncbi:MAG TPA: hypothetical protein VGE67_13885 [Haloferula sp.]
MNPEPDPSSGALPFEPKSPADPALSRRSGEVFREEEGDAAERAHRPRCRPDPVRHAPADDLCSAIGGWIRRHPTTAAGTAFALGCIVGAGGRSIAGLLGHRRWHW